MRSSSVATLNGGSMQAISQPEVTNRLLQEMVRRIVEVAHPDRIVLFGSRARGDNRPDSDVDLLVILPSDEPHYVRARPLYRALRDIFVPTDIVVYTPDEVDNWRNVRQALVATALREGTVLYERPERSGTGTLAKSS